MGDAMAIEPAAPPDAGAVFLILDSLMRRAPLPGRAEPATLAEASDAIVRLGASSADIAAAMWTAVAVRKGTKSDQGDLGACAVMLTTPPDGGRDPALRKDDLLEFVGEREYLNLLDLTPERADAAKVDPDRAENRLRTRIFYTQKSFNLLREASEGYAKLLCLLGDSVVLKAGEDDPTFASAVVDQMHALMGQFHLELCKVCEIVLAACCARVEASAHLALAPLYVALLDVFEPDRVSGMLSHMLPLNYRESDGGHKPRARC
jgi:hypothetical protein